MAEARFPKPAKRSTEERRLARKRRARAARKAKPPGVKWLTDLADKLHSIRIRAYRDGCEVARYPSYRAESCLGSDVHPSRLQVAHGFTRQDKGTRFDPSNTFAACPQCHRKHTPSGAAWYGWMEERLGARVYRGVQERAEAWTKHTPEFLLSVIRECLGDISHLPDTLRKEWAQERVEALAAKIRRALENTKGEP